MSSYAEPAHIYLLEAQRLASGANTSLRQTHAALERTTSTSIKTEFLLAATEQQLSLLCILLNSTRKWSDVKFNDIRDDLERLAAQLKSLEDMKSVLLEYVAWEQVEQLQLIHDEVSRWCDLNEESTSSRVVSLQSQVSKLIEQFHSLDKSPPPQRVIIEESLEKTNALESELAELLDSLTTHYDLCLRAKDIEEGKVIVEDAEWQELRQVLESDMGEVEGIVSMVAEASDEIASECSKVDEHLAKINISEPCNTFLKKLTQFEDEHITPLLNHVQSQETIIVAKASTLSDAINSCVGLDNDLKQFKSSHSAYVKELSRRKAVQDQMTQLIQETQTKIDTLQVQDFEKRRKFWADHGNFLPAELYKEQEETEALVGLKVTLGHISQVKALGK